MAVYKNSRCKAIGQEENMDLETLWYEALPYLYLVAGVASIIYAPSYLGRLSGGLLIVAALTILKMRRTYRRAREVEVDRGF
jgi:hypothetical protein